MNIQKVTKANAFSPGKNTWFLPQLSHSKWTRKVDWYLNFVISRADNHNSAQLSPKLESIISENELPLQPIKCDDKAPALFASHSRLPNHQTIVINFNNDIQTWVTEIQKIWQNLNQPQSRIFLPVDISIDEFKNLWPKTESDSELDVVAFDN